MNSGSTMFDKGVVPMENKSAITNQATSKTKTKANEVKKKKKLRKDPIEQ